MVLSDKTIKNLALEQNLINNFNSKQLQPASYDCKLDGKIFVFNPETQEYDKPMVISDIHDLENGKIRYLESLEFILASTTEKTTLSDSLVSFVQGRSSIGRIGLQVQNAGFIDPVFKGTITLELFNASKIPIDLFKLMQEQMICQLVFMKMDRACEKPYNGHYQGQEGVTKSVISTKKD